MSAALIGGGVFLLIILVVVAYMMMSGKDTAGGPTPEVVVPQTEEEKVAASAEGGMPEGAEAGGDDEAQPVGEDEGDAAAEKVVEEEVDEDEPDVKPTDIPGLVGYFTADSFDERENVWKDKSGKNNHAEEVKGEPEIVDEDGMKWLRGGKDSGIRFPTACMTRGRKFTLVHVARYDGQNGGRIFDGLDCQANFVSGYHWSWWGRPRDQAYGGSHRSGTGWIAHPYIIPEDQREMFNVTVEWKHKARYNGLQRSGKVVGSAVTPQQMTINWGCATTSPNGQQTDWAVAEVMFFNTELDLETTKKLETYLFKKYKRPRLIRSYVDPWNMWKLETGNWWKPFKDCSGANCADQYRAWDRMGGECGEEGAINRTHMHRHHRNHPKGGNGAYWWWNSCISGLENQSGVEKKTSYVNIADSSSNSEKLKALTEMNCRDTGIAAYEWELSNDRSRMRLKYTCNGTPVEEDSCREIQANRHGLDIHTGHRNGLNNARLHQKGPMSAMETQDLDCGPNQVLTKVEYEEDDKGGVRMKGKCCSLQDV